MALLARSKPSDLEPVRAGDHDGLDGKHGYSATSAFTKRVSVCRQVRLEAGKVVDIVYGTTGAGPTICDQPGAAPVVCVAPPEQVDWRARLVSPGGLAHPPPDPGAKLLPGRRRPRLSSKRVAT